MKLIIESNFSARVLTNHFAEVSELNIVIYDRHMTFLRTGISPTKTRPYGIFGKAELQEPHGFARVVSH